MAEAVRDYCCSYACFRGQILATLIFDITASQSIIYSVNQTPLSLQTPSTKFDTSLFFLELMSPMFIIHINNPCIKNKIIYFTLIMKNNESELDMQAEIAANITNLQQFYGLNSADSLKRLVQIIVDPKKSELLFKQKSVPLSSIFQQAKQADELNTEHIAVFADKYSYEKLVQKYPRPRGETNRMLTSILQKKMAKQPISSHQTRKNIWLLVSGARFNMNHHKGQYEQLLKYEDYPDYFLRAIKQDINRTVSKSLTSTEELQSLSNILIAFSRRNPYVGYCQGLNFVAYFLLTMQFTEEEVFWIMSQIIETVIPMDYYTNMIGVVCDQQVFLNVLGQIYPQITAKFNEVGLDPSVLSIEWFVCLFTSSLPFALVKIVWDRLLVEGPRAFIKAGIIILGYFQKKIMEVTEFHQIILLLERGTKQLIIPETEFNQAFEKIYISRRGLILARTLYREYHIKQKLTERATGRRGATENILCDPRWPICVASLQKHKRIREEMEVWIFRGSRPIRIDHQYLQRQKESNKEKAKDNAKKNQKGQALISPNYSQFINLKPITQEKEGESTIEKQGQSFAIEQDKQTSEMSPIARHTVSYESEDMKSLIIGRMDHICTRNQQESSELKKDNLARKSIILNPDQANEELKRQNYKKIIGVPEMIDPDNEEQLEEDEMYRRSQTIQFFSKFVTDNLELSHIIVPSTNLA